MEHTTSRDLGTEITTAGRREGHAHDHKRTRTRASTQSGFLRVFKSGDNMELREV